MGITRVYRDLVAAATLGEAVKAYNSTGAILVVGNSTGAYSATSTWLSGASVAQSTMDAGYPQRATNALTFRGTFGTALANFAWNEWGMYNACSSDTDGQLLNRKLEDPSLGTKTSAQTWQFAVTVSFTT